MTSDTSVIYRNVTITVPRNTRRNGTLFLYAFLTELPRHKSESWTGTIQQQTTMTAFIQLTQYLVPEPKTFNLLGQDKEASQGQGNEKNVEGEKLKVKSVEKPKPIAHITKKLRLTLMTDLHVLPRKDLHDIAFMIRYD